MENIRKWYDKNLLMLKSSKLYISQNILIEITENIFGCKKFKTN